MDAPEVEAFLTHLALKENAGASTQNRALSALLFLYREVLRQDGGLTTTTLSGIMSVSDISDGDIYE